VITWVDETNRTTASVAYWADLVDAREMRLLFSIADASGARKKVEQRLGIAVTRVGFGDRLWFGIDGRRVARLALAPGGERFEAQPTKRSSGGKDGPTSRGRTSHAA
jgi:hypothetical protein